MICYGERCDFKFLRLHLELIILYFHEVDVVL